jgi:hypothetical protein
MPARRPTFNGKRFWKNYSGLIHQRLSKYPSAKFKW